MRRPLVWTLLLAVGGALLAASVAALTGWPMSDTVATVAVAGASAVVASIAGAVVLRRFRNRSARAQALVIVLSAVVVLVAGILVSAAAMFISGHDLSALVVVVTVSTGIAVGAALQMAAELGDGHRALGELADRLADGATFDADEAAAVSGPSEVRLLAGRLAEASGRLEASRRRERALESSRRELITWVSHDLRSPLATIRAMSEALDDGVVDDPDTVARYHSQIRHDSERLTVLVDDLFELSRINSGALEIERRPVCLTEVVADAVAAARTHADLKGVVLVDDVDELPQMAVASQELTRVLHNLLDNAIRHTPGGGRVAIVGRADGREATIRVHDQCGGIPERDLTRVFDVAFRSDSARTKDARGGGLGLAIAKGLVEAHSGSIDVDNEGQGCTFAVRLPRQT